MHYQLLRVSVLLFYDQLYHYSLGTYNNYVVSGDIVFRKSFIFKCSTFLLF